MLTLTCNWCLETVAPDTGFVYVRDEDVRAAEGLGARGGARSEDLGVADPDTAGYLSNLLGRRASWIVSHHDCSKQDAGEYRYSIELSQLQSCRAALHWTAQLLVKNWFVHTDWRGLLLRVLDQVDESGQLTERGR